MNLNVNYIAGVSIGVSMAIFATSLADLILKWQSRVWGFTYGEKDLRLTSIVVKVVGIVFIAGATGLMR